METGNHPLVDFILRGRTQNRLPRENFGRPALVVHVYHLDVLSNLTHYAQNFPAGAEVFVTYPDGFDEDEVASVRSAFADARFVPVANWGQDIGALFQLSRQVDFSRFDLVCKIHTKRGELKPTKWRDTLLQGILGNADLVQGIMRSFADQPRLLLAGTRQLFLYGPAYIGANQPTLNRLYGEDIGPFDSLHEEWGFFGGTCFWVRGHTLAHIMTRLDERDFSSTAYRIDGSVAHAVERMFGLMVTLRDGLVRLNDAEDPSQFEIAGADFPETGLKAKIKLEHVLDAVLLPPS
jgi:lipopolysaccharide biosynthesis protein